MSYPMVVKMQPGTPFGISDVNGLVGKSPGSVLLPVLRPCV